MQPPGNVPTHVDRSSTDGFAEALRSAIEESDLGLARIRHHLAVRGVSLSTATLSHWQTGRSAPERSSSLTAVAELEDLLGLEPGRLRSLVPQPRPRGRGARTTPVAEPLGAGFPLWDRITDLIRELSLPVDDTVSLVTSRQVLELDAARCPARHRLTHVLRSRVDGTDRMPIFNGDEVPHPTLPRVVPRINCTVGEERRDPATGVAVTELCLTTPLAAGARVLVEYDVVHVPAPPTCQVMTVTHPMREAVLAVRFHPAARPATVLARHDDGGAVTDTVLTLDPGGWASVVRQDLRPGSLGVHWTWPDD
jgi:hypothetical protein